MIRQGAFSDGLAAAAAVFSAPRHSYTRMLLSCVPQLHRKWEELPSGSSAPRPPGEPDDSGLVAVDAAGDHLVANEDAEEPA